MSGRYQVIYADPPWSYKSNGTPAAKRPSLDRGLRPQSAAHYYDTLTTAQISSLPVSDLAAKDAVLFLWATNPMLPDAFDVMSAWGFRYKTLITWHKERCKGMGYWFRGHTEHMLFGVRGKITAFRSMQKNIVSLPVGKHSEKPHEFRHLIQDATVGLEKRIELFARERVHGWDAWGNEVESDIELSEKGGE